MFYNYEIKYYNKSLYKKQKETLHFMVDPVFKYYQIKVSYLSLNNSHLFNFRNFKEKTILFFLAYHDKPNYYHRILKRNISSIYAVNTLQN